MIDIRHLEKSENGHIFTTVCPIDTKLGTVTSWPHEPYRQSKFLF